MLPAIKWEPAALQKAMEHVAEEMIRAGSLVELEFHRNTQPSRAPGTVDYLFRLYQALIDAKVIPKTNA